ncbi:phosphoadenosine phosphosulfate reductase [Schizosaccharomyces octosporus yFS286]|uniref:Phosphoadenosine phosphosulfate reductase n=1 Tax=Schizosaccharomyces octosporus (strain yFS286) TaxID=483514 RepID=S9PRS0_SCHOY|nr:phosphoadenosine phosphosulfate reductase [Schizosaccharomyces octosporus yFS286]EPX70662.1 phosphoadenosine phosphosulfate reductase [Schizosaccharomyces octosporus yFS286]
MDSSQNSTHLSAQSLFNPEHLKFVNKQLSELSPPDILRWSRWTIPQLFQTSALGLSGLVILDMLSKMEIKTPMIFIDTLHHFKETIDLLDQVKKVYPEVPIHVYRCAEAASEEEFAKKFGERLWEKDENKYDFLVKVEPANRAYAELDVLAVFTGRRRSQGGERGSLDVVQVDGPVIKINPLANWSFQQVYSYIKENNVPYNVLLDRGYRSVGDYHSTQPVKEGEDERAGRWRGKEKTECGLHTQSKFSQYLAELERRKNEESSNK